MESKKVVLFIVEGPSDQSALSVILSKVFDQDEVYVYVVHGDVTAEMAPHLKTSCARSTLSSRTT